MGRPHIADRPHQLGAGLLPVFVLMLAGVTYQVSDPVSIIPILAILGCLAGRLLPRLLPGWSTPSPIIGLAVIAVIAYAATRTLSQGADVAVFAQFMLLLGAVKCFEDHTPRDDGQLLIVSIFVILAAAVNSNEFAVGVLTFAYLLLVILAAMQIQVAAVLVLPNDATKATSGTSVRARHLTGLAVGAFVWVCGLGLIVFFVLPREVGDMFTGRQGPVTQRVSQFREQVRLGTSGLISMDTTVVMTLRAFNGDREGRIPISHGTHWLRGVTLDRYDPLTGSWDRRAGGPNRLETYPVIEGSRIPLANGGRAGTYQKVEIQIDQFGGASELNTIFSVIKPDSIRFITGRGEYTHDSRDDTLRLEADTDTAFRYEVGSQVRSDEPNPLPFRMRRVPAVAEEYLNIASAILTEAGLEPDPAGRPPADDRKVMLVLTDWLESRHEYTLDIPAAPEGVDPTLWFIQSGVAGHCEYFASSLALLGRAAGVPTRVVTGYLVTEYDSNRGFYLVRRSDAHAWVEAEVGYNDWRTFDATPSASLLEQTRETISPLVRWFSRLETAWLTAFVSFDSDHQRSVVTGIDGIWQRVSDSFTRDEDAALSGDEGRPWPLIVGVAAGVGVLVFVLARRFGPRTRGDDLAAEIVAARRLLERAWRRAGTPRPPSIPLAVHASMLRDSRARRVAHAIEHAAFGPTERNDAAMGELRDAVERWRSSDRSV